MSEEYRLRQNAVSRINGTSEQGNIPRDSESEILSPCSGVGEYSSLPVEPIAESIHKPACGSPKRPRSCPPDLQYAQTHPTSVYLRKRDCYCILAIIKKYVLTGPCRDSTTIGLKVIHEPSIDSLNTLVIAEPVAKHHSANLNHAHI